MKLPLIGFCEGDLEIYESLDDAKRDIEIDDVADGIWSLFDSDERCMNLTIPTQKGFWHELLHGISVHVQISEGESVDPDGLAKQIRSFLRDSRAYLSASEFQVPDVEDLTLDQLISLCQRILAKP